MNTLVNQALSNIVTDETCFEEGGSLRMKKDAFFLILDMLPKERMSELGETIANNNRRATLLERNCDVTPYGTLKVLGTRSRAGWFVPHEVRGRRDKMIVLAHQLRPKNPLLLIGHVRALFESVGIQPKDNYGGFIDSA